MASTFAASMSGNRVVRSVTALSPIQKVGLGAALLTIVAGGFVLARGGAQSSMAPVFTDLAPRDAADVTDELISRGVRYELADGGRTVLVPSDQVYELRINLSAEGLPGASEGYSLLDKQGITTSEFRQRIDFQRALEGELGRTLRAISGVESATVHLALPEESVFIDRPSQPTASVLVTTTRGHQLTTDQVAGMVHLVAASVRDMQPENVTIADGSGVVLASGGEQRGMTADGVRSDTTTQYERDLETSIRALVAKVAGPESVAVTVKATLDLTERAATEERFESSDPDNGVVVAQNSSTETYTGAEAAAQTGVLGPDGATVEADTPGTESSYDKQDSQTSYAVNRIVEQTKYASGGVTSLNVAVLVDEARVTAAERDEIEALVATAAGIDARRGDQLSVTRLAFDTSSSEAAIAAAATDAAAQAQQQRESLIRLGVIGGLVLIAMLLAYRSTRRARREVATPIDIGTIRSGPISELPGGDAIAELDEPGAELDPADEQLALAPGDEAADGPIEDADELLDPLAAASREALDELGDLADRRPEEVAQILQSWLADEGVRR
ncbi:MAG TPA: flagellar basal-body MS-ring/collar protein FliF [Ilumatobacter sp.]|nr:flagellar basal-body MS-ring/collar protein FliF [Ilumatobacter sp.]